MLPATRGQKRSLSEQVLVVLSAVAKRLWSLETWEKMEKLP